MPKIQLSLLSGAASRSQSMEAWELTWLNASGTGLQAFNLTQGEQQWEGQVQWLAPGEGVLLWENQRIPFFAQLQEGLLSVWCQGQTYQYEIQDPSHRRGAASSGGDGFNAGVTAPMPGTVLKVLVQPGQAVEAKQPLVIMESMKMEMTLSAPAAAIVEAVLVAENQLVEIKAELVRLKRPSAE